MVGLLLSAAFTAALLSSVEATPVTPNTEGVKTVDLRGYAPLPAGVISSKDPIPEVTVIAEQNSRLAKVPSVLEGFNPTEQSPTVEIEERFIDGPDDRYLFLENQYPYGSVGKLWWSNGVYCSGSLIGPRHVLTAKHCLMYDYTGYFFPSYDSFPRLGQGVVTNIITSEDKTGSCGVKNDWAILVIDQRLGDQLGYFGIKLPDSAMMDKTGIFTHMGYPSDKDSGNRPYRTDVNTVQSFRTWDCDATGPYYTDTDCWGGQSGGPHWENAADGKKYVWGALSTTYTFNDISWSGWGSGDGLVSAVARARTEYP